MKPRSVPVFHAFTSKYPGIAAHIVTPLTLHEAFDPATSPETPAYETRGLWDTGATKTVITQATVRAMGLKPVGVTLINTANGTTQAYTYLVNVVLPNSVGVSGIQVCECANIAGNEVGALIGMDITTRGDFSITNVGGKTCVSYRSPSVETIDYVQRAEQIQNRGVNPNEPCYCGSGLKYKKCCGRTKT